MCMNRMKVFLLLAVMIGFSSCQSRSKQNIEQEVEVDSLSTNPTEEIKITADSLVLDNRGMEIRYAKQK